MPDFHQAAAKQKSPEAQLSREEFMKNFRQPPPSKPAFENDGKSLNLQNHDMFRKIVEYNFKDNGGRAEAGTSDADKEDE